jgi:Bacteriocin-protection, YdeI or OmpD-Associated
MALQKISGGTVHSMPTDLRKALVAEPKARAAWQDITPLARNEWICWTITVKQLATRKDHIKRTVAELAEGKRRPCCWIGCIHRTDKPISPSVQWALSKQSRNK